MAEYKLTTKSQEAFRELLVVKPCDRGFVEHLFVQFGAAEQADAYEAN